MPIIFITAYGDVPTCAAAFRGGAVDFLEKPVNDKVLPGHIEKLIAREEPRRGPSNGDSFGDRMGLLTPTETQVLEALIRGKSIKDIARARKVSVQTVWRHQVNIFHKVGVGSQVELVRVAVQWQIQHEPQSAEHRALRTYLGLQGQGCRSFSIFSFIVGLVIFFKSRLVLPASARLGSAKTLTSMSTTRILRIGLFLRKWCGLARLWANNDFFDQAGQRP